MLRSVDAEAERFLARRIGIYGRVSWLVTGDLYSQARRGAIELPTTPGPMWIVHPHRARPADGSCHRLSEPSLCSAIATVNRKG